jgi:type I restriction enzyme, R subunit
MARNNYSEDGLVEQPAIKLLQEEFDYDFMNCFDETFNNKDNQGTLGRNNKSEVVLVSKLKPFLIKLNPDLPLEAINLAIEELIKDRSRLSLIKSNQEIYKLIKNGVKVKVQIDGKLEDKTVKVIDYDNPENNNFFLASQFWITGEMHTRRPDLIIFVNGLPLVLIELKATGVNVKRAFDDNLTDYKDTIPQIFNYNSFIIISNGLESKIGSMTSGYEHFATWKKIESEKEKGNTYLNTILKGTCNKTNLLDLLENFTLFTSFNNKPIKAVAKNHQFLGVNNSVESFRNRKKNNGKLGVFWHTQGSGKSFSMIFFAQKVLRKFEGNYTFVVVTDRKELDSQIYKNFSDAGVVIEEEVQAKDGKHLKQLLTEDHRMIFTLIHKFRTDKGKTYPELSSRDDIIVMTDEAHRSQYDTFALNMRNALPKANFIGFTGTPLMAKGEEKTKETFGKYVSMYNFGDSIKDKATVPLYYDNRVPELQIINPKLTEEVYDVIDGADLDEKEQEKIEKRLGSNYDILTREDRLNTIAEDIIKNFINRGYQGKAMVVSIDKFTTVKMYDKVKYYLQKEIESLTKELRLSSPDERDILKEKIKDLKQLDMAVVISNEQNEIKKFKDKGLDITKHRKRMVEEELAEKFKDPDNPFKLVFVCNMWMTGFDAPSVSTIYLDKPMKNHTLMQAIARANRVFKEKQAGFIVDYINVFRNLEKALAIYAGSPGEGSVDPPIEDKEKLVEHLRNFMGELNKYLGEQKINYEKIIYAEGMDKYPLLEKAISSLLNSNQIKKDFLTKSGNAIKIYQSILPHKSASEFSKYISLYKELVKEIRSLDPEVDIESVMTKIQGTLDTSIASKGYIIKEKKKFIDISKIDFNALKEKFEKNKDNSQLERLKNILSFKLKEMLALNNTRIDYHTKFQNLVNEYNSGSSNNEEFFKKLLKFEKNLSKEERRHIIENLSEEELIIFDKLKKEKLTDKDLKIVKAASKELLELLSKRNKFCLDWRKKQQTRASVRVTIEKELHRMLPPAYGRKEFNEKCNNLFQHFFDKYPSREKNIYNLNKHNSPSNPNISRPQ